MISKELRLHQAIIHIDKRGIRGRWEDFAVIMICRLRRAEIFSGL
jgi:hypothetical protein